MLEAGDHAQHRRLTAAGRTEQRQETAVADSDRDIADSGTGTAFIGLIERVEGQLRHGITPFGSRFAISSRISIITITMTTTRTESAEARLKLPLSSRL